MKKILLALTAVSLLATMNSCGDDEPNGDGNSAPLTVEQKQRALVSYIGHSAVYGPAGSDAAINFPVYNDVVASTNTSTIVGITYQPVLVNNGQAIIPFLQPFFYKDNNDTPFVNLLSNGLLSHMNPPTTGFPVNFFYSCGSNLSAVASKADILGNANGYVSNTPEVGIAVKASAAGNTINIDYKAKAFAPEAGAEYYVSVLVIEKNGNTRQAVDASTFNSIATRNIVRTSAISANGAGGLKTPVVGLPQTGYTGISPIFGSSAAVASEVSKMVSVNYKPLSSQWETVFGENYSNWKYTASNTAVVAIVWKWYAAENKAYYSNCVYADVK
jgi:hypothetical protein